MLKKPAVRIVLVLSLLTLVGIAALAAGGHHGIVTSADRRQTIATHGPSSHITPLVDDDAGLTVIAGNLSKYPFGVYFCCYGFTISGPNSIIGDTFWSAVAFTPSANYNVGKIKVSAAYVTGSNSVRVSLNADAGGVPGAELGGTDVSGLGTFGACCTLAVVKSKTGIPVSQGTQYWVVVSTDNKSNDTWDAWAFNSTDMRLGLVAGYSSGAWSSGDNQVPGYAVLGVQQ
jgi:hypothetical protein